MKGISPMLAVILLIAFTVAVGGLLSVWIISMTRTQTGVAGAGAEKLIACSKSVLDIGSVVRTGSYNDTYNVQVIYYAGSEDLYNFTIYLSDATGKVGKHSSTVFTKDNPMRPGQIYTFNATLDVNLTSQNPTRARVTALCQDTEMVSAEEALA